MQQIIHGIGEKTEKGREEGKEAVLMLYTHTAWFCTLLRGH